MFNGITCLIVLVLLHGCKYKLSSYSAHTPDQKLNLVNLERIRVQEQNESSEFKIALISDTHNYYKELKELIKTINVRGPYSFVVICGDVTNLGLLEEFDTSRNFFNRLNYPYLVSIGNHDLLANGDFIYKRMFGPSDFSFIYRNVQFIFFDNNNWENSSTAPDMAWVTAKLLESGVREKVLIAHIPPNDQERFKQSQIQSWENLIFDQKVKYFINGHNHNPVENTFGGAVQITIGAPTKGSYFELIVGPGGINHQKIDF